jgi:uncharacterized protein involved in exopolysaccharide biosynthesis
MRVANRLTDLFVEENQKTRESEAASTSAFLDTQLNEAKKTLDDLEKAVSAYKLQHNGELPQQEQSLGGTLSRLNIELEANRDAINRAQSLKISMEGNLHAMEATLAAWEQAQRPTDANGSSLPADAATGTQKKRSEVLQDELNELLGRYGETYPDVVRKKADLASAKRAEEQQQATNPGALAPDAKSPAGTTRTRPAASLREPPDLVNIRQQVESLKAQIRAQDKEEEDCKTDQQRILKDIDVNQRRMERLPVREQEMAGLTRDYEMSKDNYKNLLAKKDAAEMSLDMERLQQSERFTVLERAQVPERPIKPKRPMLYAGGTAFGLALALVVGLAVELRRNVLLGEWELPAGTPILARLPYIEVQIQSGPESQSRNRWFWRRKKLANVSATPLILAATAGLYSLFHRL